MTETTLILAASLLPLSLGVFLSYRVFRIPDITTDGSFSLGGALFIWAVQSGISVWAGLLIGFSGACLAGMTTAFLFNRLKIPALLAGILVMGSLFSVNLIITGRANLPMLESAYAEAYDERTFRSLMLTSIISLITFLFIQFMLRSDFGLALRAAGGNQEAATAQGIQVGFMQSMGLALANGLSGLSGALMVLSQGFWDINMGTGIIIAGMASVMIAEALSSGRGFFFHFMMLLPSTLLYRWLIAQVLSFGMEPVYVKLITSLLVISILALIHFRNRSGNA